MKSFLWLYISIFSVLLLPLMGYKTKSLVLQDEVWDQGQYEKTFINQEANLQLTPEFNKVFSVTDSVIWDVYREGERTWVATGSEGGVYLFEREQLQTRLQLADKEITSIAQGGDFMYFGSGSEGKVFRIPASTTEKEVNTPWVETGEQFIWDMVVYQDSLWLATGGERGKVFRIPLDRSGPVPAQEEPVLIFAEPNALKLRFREEGGTAYLYAAVSTAGKLYRIPFADLGKPSGKLEVLFDAGDKDVADFIFVEEAVYLITSGTGKVVHSESSSPPQEENSNGGGLVDPQGLSIDFNISSLGEDYENFLVQIGPNREVKFLYRFRKKNPARLAYREKEGHLYIGVLENAEVYQMILDEKALPKSVQIFSRPSATLSDLYLFQDQIYFTLANLGDIYRLEKVTATRGEYLTKVFDFKETVHWGQVVVENHNPGTEVQIWSRSGSTQDPDTLKTNAGKDDEEALTPVEDWSSWAEVVGGRIPSPPARFLQIKLGLVGSGKGFSSHPFESDSPLIKNVKIFYGQKNAPHRITSFKLYKQEFNPMLFGGDQSPPRPGGLFDVYDADHSLNTTYSTEDKHLIPSLNPDTSPLPFPKIGKKEYGLKWEVENFDQDVLVYTVYYRNYTSSQPERWRPFRDNYLGNMILLDGYKFIDGVYQFKVVAEDRLQNREEEIYRAEAVTVQQVFDNKPPIIEDIRWQGDTLFFKVRDSLSPIASVKYTIDRQTVSLLSPRDGIYDEGHEEFQFQMGEISEMVLIVKDGADNILYHDVVKNP